MGATGRVLVTGMLLVTGTLLLPESVAGAVAAAPALAAQDGADQITITGGDLPEPLVIRAGDSPRTSAALHEEIDWVRGRSGDAQEPAPQDRGPAYTVEVHVDGEARHRYELYPLADGGPRIHRPAEQPGDREADEAWFYGRLSMPETLATAGVPLPGLPGPGGAGGGDASPTPTPAPESAGMLAEWREGVLFTGLVGIAIAAGIGGIAFLIRRKV